MSPKVSVVIATHNHAHFLPECLVSVKAQTYQDYEVIVVNNGSTDNTEEVVKKLAWDKLRYHYQENTGSVAGPRNTGIRLAAGEYVAFLDSDDTWHENKLEKVMRTFAQNPGIDIIAHDLLLCAKERSVLAKAGPVMPKMFDHLLINGNCLGGSATVVSKKALVGIGGFDENKDFVHAEDYEAWLRLAYRGYKFYFINEILGQCKIHESNLSNDFELVMKNWINVLNKHFARPEAANSLNRLRLRNRSIGKVYFVTAIRYLSKRKLVSFFKSAAASFLLNPFHFFEMAIEGRRSSKYKAANQDGS